MVWPLQKLSPILDDVAGELGDDVKVVKVNVDEERTLGAMFQIMSIPSVLIFRNGEKVDEFVDFVRSLTSWRRFKSSSSW